MNVTLLAAGYVCEGGDVDQCDHGAVDFVLSAIGEDFELVTSSAAIGELFLDRLEVGHNLQDHGLERRDLDGGIDVEKGPADISRYQPIDLLRARSEAANGQVVAN